MAVLFDDTFVVIDDVFVVMDCNTAAELTAIDPPDTTANAQWNKKQTKRKQTLNSIRQILIARLSITYFDLCLHRLH